MKKLRIKEAGEIVELVGEFKRSDGKPEFTLDSYETLAELCEAVEDYEEPKGIQWVDVLGANDGRVVVQCHSEEEAKKAVEELKAWQRLSKNKYLFRQFANLIFSLNLRSREFDEYMDDILLIFGGEE